MAGGMGSVITENREVVYTLYGKSRDIETIVRLRPWIEDEVLMSHGPFTESKLFTDYDAKTEIFEFKIIFFK